MLTAVLRKAAVLVTMTGDDEPISPSEARPLFEPFQHARGWVLAVSGGADSMALMRLGAGWAAQTGAVPPSVATVDHGLRTASRGEAEAVGQWAAAVGLPHAILASPGKAPRSRIQERAREVRYGLLADHARAVNASHVILAHHADDQAETVLFRLIRGSGITGLAGMPALQCRHGIVFARPLLAYPKRRLIASCVAAGQAYVEDPSNSNERFVRARLRRLMPLMAAEGLDREALLRLARRAARAEAALQRAAETAFEDLRVSRSDARLTVDLRRLDQEPEEVALRAMQRLLDEVNPAALRLERLERLVSALMAAVHAGAPLRATLGGVLVLLDAQGKVTMRRETTRRRGRLPPV